jgi:hypothetical protein
MAGVIAEKVRVMFHSLIVIVIITTTATWWQGLEQGQVFCFSKTSRPALGLIYILDRWSPEAVSPWIMQPLSEAGHFYLRLCIC